MGYAASEKPGAVFFKELHGTEQGNPVYMDSCPMQINILTKKFAFMLLQLVNYLAPSVLPANIYNQSRVVYPGNSVFDTATNLTTTWAPTATFPTQADKSYQILAVSPSLEEVLKVQQNIWS